MSRNLLVLLWWFFSVCERLTRNLAPIFEYSAFSERILYLIEKLFFDFHRSFFNNWDNVRRNNGFFIFNFFFLFEFG